MQRTRSPPAESASGDCCLRPSLLSAYSARYGSTSRTTDPYITACSRKLISGPNSSIITPASPGPTIRIELNAIEFSAIAFIRRTLGTEFATSVCRSGLFSAQPMPVRNEKT